MADRFTQFDYLLNALEASSQTDAPAEHGYGEKRRKLYEHVRELERKAVEADQLRALWTEWELGEYDGRDLLRRVRLALHGRLHKPGTDGVAAPALPAVVRALRAADMALSSWENGYAFDSHGPSREAQRLVTEALNAGVDVPGEAGNDL